MLQATTGPLITAVGLSGLLASEYLKSIPGRCVFKPLASLGFLVTASPGLQTSWGTTVFSSLVLCLVGDVFLLNPIDSPALFQAGLFSFLLGHLGFAYAFFQRGVDTSTAIAAAAGNAVVAGIIWRWLSPHLPKADRIPVALYVGVISAMATFAISSANTWPEPKNWIQIAGAIIFQASDLFVARNQFVQPALINPLIGLPLYYGAVQLLARLTW